MDFFPGKLLSRATKIAYMLLNKQVTITLGGVKEKVHLCVAGDRVALVYPNTEPLDFLAAFYGCLLAGVVPVPIEVPLTKRVSIFVSFRFYSFISGRGYSTIRFSSWLVRRPCRTNHRKLSQRPSKNRHSNNNYRNLDFDLKFSVRFRECRLLSRKHDFRIDKQLRSDVAVEFVGRWL